MAGLIRSGFPGMDGPHGQVKHLEPGPGGQMHGACVRCDQGRQLLPEHGQPCLADKLHRLSAGAKKSEKWYPIMQKPL